MSKLPKSHIYVAGSFAQLNRSRKGDQRWKIGHCYNIVDRFLTGSDSYEMKYPMDGYIPRYIWHWVENGREIEPRILSSFKGNSKIVEKTDDFPYSSEVVVTTSTDELIKEISRHTDGECTFSWNGHEGNQQDYAQCYALLKKLLIKREKLSDKEEYEKASGLLQILLSGYKQVTG